MINITISSSHASSQVLRNIAAMMDQGMTSGLLSNGEMWSIHVENGPDDFFYNLGFQKQRVLEYISEGRYDLLKFINNERDCILKAKERALNAFRADLEETYGIYDSPISEQLWLDALGHNADIETPTTILTNYHFAAWKYFMKLKNSDECCC